jgi:pimeloyl-ACP methyl ester carboxylesterase
MTRLRFGVARAPKSIGVLKDPENDWALNQTFSLMSEKAAETGECLYAARRVDEGNGDTWIDEWASLAARVEALGDESLTSGHTISARESYLRASNYWRTAEYACPPSHARFTETWQRSVAAFRKACPLLAPTIELLQVPFEGWQLSGYFARPDTARAPRPTVVIVGGSDSSLEQMVIAVGFAALRRGYNIFAFDYPGHRGAVHHDPSLVKRSDYSPAFAASLDVLGAIPGVDERVVLAGYSYGGYVASQVATVEPRVRALVADSPLIDLPALQRSSPMARRFSLIPDHVLDRVVASRLAKSAVIKGLTYYTLWSWGCPDFVAWKTWKPKLDNVLADRLQHIECPALALVSAHEGDVMIQQATSFMEAIASKHKQLHIFTPKRDGSYDHCQLDNISRGQQVMFDWLDKVFFHSTNRQTT